MNPSTREEFDELQAAISKKVQSFAKSPHFPAFAEELIRNICVNCKCINNFWWLLGSVMVTGVLVSIIVPYVSFLIQFSFMDDH